MNEMVVSSGTAGIQKRSLMEYIRGHVDHFLASQDVKENSRETYRRALKPFIEWVGERGMAGICREDILAYRQALVGRKLSAYTVSSCLVAVRKFFAWSESMGYSPDVARGIKGPKRPRGFSKDALTEAQAVDLLKSIDRTTLAGKRDFALLLLLNTTGMRTIEAVRADIGDIRQESGNAVLWIQGKGRDHKDELVVLSDDVHKAIMVYLAARGDSQSETPLFTSLSDRNMNQRLTTISVSRIVKNRLRGIGIDSHRLTAHALRHTAITLALVHGATIQEAQAMARHASITTTMIYSHNIDRLKQAPERKLGQIFAGL